MISQAGGTLTNFTRSRRRWVSKSKGEIVSISSAKNSIRNGFSSWGGKKSRIPPRRENCPVPSMTSVRVYPEDKSLSQNVSGLMVCPSSTVKKEETKCSESGANCKTASIDPTTHFALPDSTAQMVLIRSCSHSKERPSVW
ncbi:hypothetical protein SDC9_198078 [bioreactor metagenome]|uniref:Uncharacterized protein n=1 Tax=bioreactor metagenome TaxID=1076179 RepID=A0A645IGM1_9ZZZZ